jgi:HSP20 family protein
MTLVRWDPFRELNSLGQLGRFFDRFPDWSQQSPTTTSAWAPNVDIFEGENELVVKAELPGIDPKDVELNVENNVLTISGERKLEFEDKKENYHRVERAYGSFSRSFSLPRLIDENKIEADYRDGVLTVRIPKHEKAKPRQIKISA